MVKILMGFGSHLPSLKDPKDLRLSLVTYRVPDQCQLKLSKSAWRKRRNNMSAASNSNSTTTAAWKSVHIVVHSVIDPVEY
jgi:hypothetical protein